MFHQLTRYVFDQWLPQTTSSTAAEGVETDTAATTSSTRLTSADTEDDWVLVDRQHDDDADSEGNSDTSSLEDLDVEDDGLVVVERSPDRVVVIDMANIAPPALLRRTLFPTWSLPQCLPMEELSECLPMEELSECLPMEESWFLTPPPCFISTGPVHMETSPLENLLIEHPSMSVYRQHRRRYHHLRSAAGVENPQSGRQEEVQEVDLSEVQIHTILAHGTPPLHIHLMQGQERRQVIKGKHAQKAQVKKACKSAKRGSLNRNNKAREVNSRNRRQRRGERSQGATRSYANNNRKC